MTHIREEWKPVVGFETAYEVSNQGRVRQVGKRSNAPAPRLMKQNLFCKGIHLYVGLCPNGKGDQNHDKIQKKLPVHYLVAAAFLGPRPAGMVVNHKDGFSFNNWAENLEYCTHADNVHHALRTGLTVISLTADKVRQIRALPRTITNMEAAKMFGVDNSQISRIRNRKAWAYLPD